MGNFVLAFFLMLQGLGTLSAQVIWDHESLEASVLKNNRDLLSEGEMVRSLESRAWAQGTQIMNPTVGILGLESGGPFRFTLSQEIPNPFTLEAQGRSGSSMARSRELGLRSMEKQKLFELEKSLWNLSALEQIQENRKKERQLLERVFNASRIQYSNGKLSFSQLSALEIRIATLEMDLLDQDAELFRARLNIKELAGVQDSDFKVKAANLAPPGDGWPQINRENLGKLYLAQSPARGAAFQSFLGSTGEADAQVSRTFPAVGFMAEGMFDPGLNTTQLTFGVEVTLPLWGIGSQLAENSAAFQEAQSRKYSLEALDLSQENRISDLVYALEKDLAALGILEKRVMKAGDENLVHMTREYEVQGADLQTLVDTLVTTFELKNRYFGLLSRVHSAYAELKALTGAKNGSLKE